MRGSRRHQGCQCAHEEPAGPGPGHAAELSGWSEPEGEGLIRAADRAVGRGAVSADRVIADAAEAIALPLPRFTAIEAFDAFTRPDRIGARRAIEGGFALVAGPRQPPGTLRPGDVVVRRALGEGFGHSWLIASPERVARQGVAAAGLVPETDEAGDYVHVVEGGPRPHVRSDRFARRIAGPEGLLPADTLVLRPRLRSEYSEGFVWPSAGAAEQVPGTCADTIEPHVLLLRGTIRPAVREAQRKLNLYHTLERTAGRPGLPGMPLVEDCNFGQHTFDATREFQRQVFPGQTVEHDGKIGDHTWAKLDTVGNAARPRSRPCCILASSIPIVGSNLVDPTVLGTHGAADEANGLIYTGAAGFFDLGHARDTCDLTKFILDQINAVGGAAGHRVATIHGDALITATIPAADRVAVARAICYDNSFAYEIWTYDLRTLPGQHNSAFSPEDLPSNYFGTLLAADAIAAGGSFNAAVTTALTTMINSLAPQTVAESLNAFNLIRSRWVNFTGPNSILSQDYLRRRNFDRIPWKTSHPSDVPTPAALTAGFGLTTTYHDYTHTVDRRIRKSDFGTEVTRIRTDARSRYGPDFATP